MAMIRTGRRRVRLSGSRPIGHGLPTLSGEVQGVYRRARHSSAMTTPQFEAKSIYYKKAHSKAGTSIPITTIVHISNTGKPVKVLQTGQHSWNNV